MEVRIWVCKCKTTLFWKYSPLLEIHFSKVPVPSFVIFPNFFVKNRTFLIFDESHPEEYDLQVTHHQY